MGLLDDISAAGDRQVRAVCLQAAATLCSGNLVLDSELDAQGKEVFIKVIVLANSFQEWLRYGTVGGRTVEEWNAEDG